MIKVRNKIIGAGHPCFIVAEIGINHNGNMEIAKKTVDAAIEAGADAVKFQNYYTEDFILDRTLTYSYVSRGERISESQFEMFKRYELSFEQLLFLKDYCDKKGVIFFSTPTSKRGIDDLKKINVSLLKNGSDLLVNLDIIKDMAQTGIPTIISTGMATISEIDDAVRVFEQAGGKDLIILHCISSYPTPPEMVNLRKISALEAAFGYPVGFSDHTDGVTAAVGAVAMGACLIEKHFTLDKLLPGPDHSFSSDKDEMIQLIKAVRTIEKNLGTSKIGPTEKEMESRRSFRLSCVAASDIPSGKKISKDDIAFSRPSNGIPPKMASLLYGRKARRQIATGELISIYDVE